MRRGAAGRAYALRRSDAAGAVGREGIGMAGRDTYLEHLASVPLFAACSRKDLQRIARASDEVQIPEGRALAKQGEVGRECFVLVDGKVKVERNGRKVASLRPGSYFGHLSLLDKGP